MAGERALSTDRKQDIAVAETFPASDPVATRGERGARAVPVEELMSDGAAPQEPAEVVTLRRGFEDAETAKIALEGLVRDGPVDRSLAEIVAGEEVVLMLRVPANDAARIEGLLQRA